MSDNVGRTFLKFKIRPTASARVCSSSVCLPDNYNKMDLPPVDGPVIVNTTIILIDIFEVFVIGNNHYPYNLLKVHPETFTLDLSLYLKFAWKDNRIELANG